ncbi:MAG: hypothetical protein AB1592_19450 [Pseudomonadota bacterium]
MEKPIREVNRKSAAFPNLSTVTLPAPFVRPPAKALAPIRAV